MDNLINSILDIDKDINYQYRTSTKPKFIKKFIAKRRRKKVLSAIEKLHKIKNVDFSMVTDYINSIYLSYPPYGSYLNCVKIEPVEIERGELSALFKFIINEKEKEIGIVALSPDSSNGTYLIRFVWSKDSLTKFVFAEENVRFLENTESYNVDYPYSAKIENTVIKDCFCKCIMDNIYEYLIDEVKRSERVIDDDRTEIK